MEDITAFAPLKKQVWGCVVNVIIPTNLIYVLFDPAIPTSLFNFIWLSLYLFLFFIALSIIHLTWFTVNIPWEVLKIVSTQIS